MFSKLCVALLFAFLLFAQPLFAAKDIDVFIVAGQSNAVGQGDVDESPKVPDGIAYQFYDGVISTANDPIGNAHTGSAWPQFALTYHEKTGRHAAFVSTAIGGTSLLLLADRGNGNWSEQGKLFNECIEKTHTALDAFRREKFRPHLKGILWVQGEADGMRMPDVVAQDDYEGALRHLVKRFRDALQTKIPFYIFQIGTHLEQGEKGYKMVRDVQDHVENPSDKIFVVSRAAITFPSRGMMKDNVHYTQSGYNEMGRLAAENVAKATGY